MLLDLYRHAPGLQAHHFPACDQLQRVLIIQSHRPTDGKFHAFPGSQRVFRRKQHTGAGDINGFALSYLFPLAPADGSITQFTLNWISLGSAALAWGLH
jgi:hypothetical protein